MRISPAMVTWRGQIDKANLDLIGCIRRCNVVKPTKADKAKLATAATAPNERVFLFSLFPPETLNA